MRVKFFDIAEQTKMLSDELEAAVLSVLESGQYILGPKVQTFETRFAEFIGTKYAVGVGSGTDALVISLRALGIGPGDEVIVPSFTFYATAEAVANVGAKTVFADVDVETMNITAEHIAKKLTKATKAVIPVHLFGLSAPMNEIMELADQKRIFVIEDVAQATGATCNGIKAGSFGDMAAFSFFPTKNLAAAGDGGAITTNSEELATKARKLRNHGSIKKYRNEMLGYNSRLDAIQAVVLTVRLGYIQTFIDLRRRNAAKYSEMLSGIEQIALPKEPDGLLHTYNQFTIRVLDGRRDELRKFLASKGIETMVYYEVPVHRLEPFAGNYDDSELPNTMLLCSQVLSLPIFPELTSSELEYVAYSIREFFK